MNLFWVNADTAKKEEYRCYGLLGKVFSCYMWDTCWFVGLQGTSCIYHHSQLGVSARTLLKARMHVSKAQAWTSHRKWKYEMRIKLNCIQNACDSVNKQRNQSNEYNSVQVMLHIQYIMQHSYRYLNRNTNINVQLKMQARIKQHTCS